MPANGAADYEVVYHPLNMTANAEVPSIKDESHNATLFFPIPDGTAILYNLIGYSKPPSPIENLNIGFKAKTNHV